ncbi:MAG: CBS domain-containing protein [Treponemataceae bacterium]
MISKEDYCVTKNYTVKEVIETLERIRERGVIVIDENKKVCGVLSQGDIIYALANGCSFYSKIDKLYSSNFIYLTSRDLKKAFSIFKKRNLCLIPVIDHDYNLNCILTARELLSYANFSEDELLINPECNKKGESK